MRSALLFATAHPELSVYVEVLKDRRTQQKVFKELRIEAGMSGTWVRKEKK